MQHVTTLTDIILAEEKKSKRATGSLTLLLTIFENVGKIIASHVRRTGLVDILGSTGKKNRFADDVQKLDEFANDLLVKTLSDSGQVKTIASEELEDPVIRKNGKYDVFIDPLDGSSNIDANSPIGTIFSVYHAHHQLQPGKKQVAAGYILYGASTMFVYTAGFGVHGFTLDPGIGSFLLSYPTMRIPDYGTIYAINEGNSILFDKQTHRFLSLAKENTYKLRYSGTLVADVHRILIKGGIFLYPADKKHKNGKLRLMYEVNPMAFLVEQAGGAAVSPTRSPLTITPADFHQQAPLIIGSKKNVKDFLSVITR